MIKHIVMWKVKKEITLTPDEVALQFSEALQPLVGQIEGLISIEVGADLLKTDASYDIVLVAIFNDLASLAAYQPHPLHIKVVEAIIKPCVANRVVIDIQC